MTPYILAALIFGSFLLPLGLLGVFFFAKEGEPVITLLSGFVTFFAILLLVMGISASQSNPAQNKAEAIKIGQAVTLMARDSKNGAPTASFLPGVVSTVPGTSAQLAYTARDKNVITYTISSHQSQSCLELFQNTDTYAVHVGACPANGVLSS